MKPVIADRRYRCHGVRIECSNGLIVRLTDYPRDLDMGGTIYQTDSGYQFTGQQAGTGLSAAVMDLDGVASIAGIDRDELASGVFDGARLYVFATTYTAPTEDEEPIGAAILGKTTLLDDRYRVEMMSLSDLLGQSVGKTYTAPCPKRLGGQEFAGCKVDLAPLTVPGTVTAVTSAAVVRDAARTEAADWFAMGTIEWLTGDNAGLKPQEIKRYDADGTIETYEPAYYAPQIGDTFQLVPGCRKRLEDCRDKYDNVINFGGFPYIPVSSQYGEIGRQ